MQVIDAIYARRTVRKFTQEPVPVHVLRELVDCARVGPCSANMQPLKYKVVCQAETDLVFPYLRWAVAIAPEGASVAGGTSDGVYHYYSGYVDPAAEHGY